MVTYSYISIKNFKIFGEEIRIPLNNPTVLIGPNNAGKTTVIQALALWHWAVKSWVNGKRQHSTSATSIYKRDIIQVPVSEIRFFWTDAIVRGKNQPLEMKISVGVNWENEIIDCEMIFKYFSPEQVSCFPSNVSNGVDHILKEKTEKALKHIANVRIDLLYPMSGIDVEEPMLQEGRINVLIGQGQTAQVLRNLCLQVAQNFELPFDTAQHDWNRICQLMKQLFFIDLKAPHFNANRGTVELKYTKSDKQKNYPLDIAMSGRGQQQMLLILAYMYAHKGSVLLIDEPDAHLEILRQRQVFSLLKEISRETGSQIIIATHSEVIVDEAVDVNLNLILNGKNIDIADKSKIKDTLRIFGIEHYYKAETAKRILYVEGSTDIEMLRAFAKLLNHKSLAILDEALYYYYVTDNLPDQNFEKDIQKSTGHFQSYKKHFYAVKSCVEDFKGIGIFDSDNKTKSDEVNDDLAVLFWKRYEIENYIVTKESILAFFENYYGKSYEGLLKPLLQNKIKIIGSILDSEIQNFIFDKNTKAFNEYNTLPDNIRKLMFKNLSLNKKMSLFLENIFRKISQEFKEPIILNKGSFYQLIHFCDKEEIDEEIIQKLDSLYKYLKK